MGLKDFKKRDKPKTKEEQTAGEEPTEEQTAGEEPTEEQTAGEEENDTFDCDVNDLVNKIITEKKNRGSAIYPVQLRLSPDMAQIYKKLPMSVRKNLRDKYEELAREAYRRLFE